MSNWFNSTPESEALLAEERLVLAASEMVYEAMQQAGVNKRELARRLGVRPTEVSQRLNGRRNLTLRTLAAMLHRLGMRAELRLRPALPAVGAERGGRMLKFDVIPPGNDTAPTFDEFSGDEAPTFVPRFTRVPAQ